jgi:hypothetical protein
MDALGMLGSLDAAADIVTVTDTARPDRVETEAYAQLLPIFDRAYEALVPTFADLADAAAHLPLRAPSTRAR